MVLVLFGVVLPWVVIAVAAWLALRMLKQNGRMLQLVDALEEGVEGLYDEWEANKPPEGLHAGEVAPSFELPDLDGDLHSLERFRGSRVLLIFFSPDCAFCQEMAPRIAALPWDGSEGRPVPLLISMGDAGKNRAFMDEHQIRCPVLLQDGVQGAVATAYLAEGTPVGYLIDEQGILATGVTEGSDYLLAMADPGFVPPAPEAAAGAPKGTRLGSGLDGLKPGMQAPEFRVPRLDGGELALEDYRGRRLLLVFSDPECEPCDVLVPELERLHRAGSAFAIAMVSRGDIKTNRAKVKEHGLSFPVGLQRDWEISRLYRKGGITPSGYVIDESGVIVADMAVAGDQLVQLASGTDVPANPKGGAD